MSHGYFGIMLEVVSQQEGKINNTNPKPLNNNNNMASPYQTDPSHVLARANRKCTPSQVTMNKKGIGQTMKGKKIKPLL